VKKNNSTFKISIVTVVYNGEQYLENTILSILNQNYENIEYIIIDGASSDKTIEIIKKYEDRITYWVSEKDNGIYDAMNKGINVATGTFINFMNAGDSFFSNNVLTNISKEMMSHDNEIIYGNVVYEHQDGILFIDDKSRKKQANIYEINHQSCFYKLNLHKKYGLYSLKYPISADFLFLNTVIKQSIYNPLKVNVSVVKYDETGFSRINIIKHQIEKIKISIELYGLTLYIISPSITVLKVLIKKIIRKIK
jgi:glycosyltransferase involved in cell wall biosynthesis